uniref:Uncharacterized protein n=1 Tax=Panagrolaimus sp. ES5 TaxID=591445 RepID=A0AC34FG18_9BILA
MKAKRKIICDHSSTDSSSGTLSYGALCISTKAKNINKGKSQWTTNFKNRGVSLVETNVAKSSDLVKLFQKCQANGRNGGNALSFEISDENGFGCSGTEVIKKGSHLLKKRRKQNDKIVNDKEILYDVSQLIKDNVSWASSSFIRSPQILKSRNKKEYQCTRQQLFKNRLESFVEKNVEKELPRSPLLHKRLADFPYKVNTRYSNAPVPRPGLYGHEIPMHFISQSIKIRLNEFEDVEEHEKAFYFLWNSFNAERSNRRLGMLSMNDKLNVGILNEKQFFTLSFYRTPLENKWFGCNAPLIKK